ncbi:MAG: TetR family transcriptional regulator [Acidimicrobiales bacterium]|jgi:AcrR family transcriptional regulator
MTEPLAGLRERKKAKTRLAIREHAMALFREQGYDRTTVEQIAAAAEVSPSTFFRYFPSKEEVVLQDDYDPLLIAAFQSQPVDTPPAKALRNAMYEVFSSMPDEERAREFERERLMMAVPELRARMLAQITDMIQMLAEVVAERVGRPVDDFEVRNFAGALIGMALGIELTYRDGPVGDYLELFDRGLAHLEAGLPL